jgi:isoleucyl-tRNA synthetase
VLDVWFDSGSTHAFTLESPRADFLNFAPGARSTAADR